MLDSLKEVEGQSEAPPHLCMYLIPQGLDPAVLRDQLFELWNRKDLQTVRVTFTACVNSTHTIQSECAYKGRDGVSVCLQEALAQEGT